MEALMHQSLFYVFFFRFGNNARKNFVAVIEETLCVLKISGSALLSLLLIVIMWYIAWVQQYLTRVLVTRHMYCQEEHSHWVALFFLASTTQKPFTEEYFEWCLQTALTCFSDMFSAKCLLRRMQFHNSQPYSVNSNAKSLSKMGKEMKKRKSLHSLWDMRAKWILSSSAWFQME